MLNVNITKWLGEIIMKKAIPLLFVFILAACSSNNEVDAPVPEVKEESSGPQTKVTVGNNAYADGKEHTETFEETAYRIFNEIESTADVNVIGSTEPSDESSKVLEDLTIELENHPEHFKGDQGVILEALNDMASSSVTMDQNKDFFFDSNQYLDASNKVKQYLKIEQ